MEGRERDCLSRRRRLRRGMMLLLLIVLTVTAGAAGSSLTEAKVQKAQKTSSDCLIVENRGCEVMELNPLRMEEYPEITEAVRGFYRQQQEEAGFVESYDDVRVYTKEGRYKGTYVAFARYDMKIRDIYTKVPGLGTVYVEEDGEGGYQVSASVEDEDVKSYIRKIAEHGDVQALMDSTQSSYQTALKGDALLQEALADLKNAYEGSTGS
ncbi:MAG: hypothetical protein K1W22_10725 [Lachnospiraceae bacterium]